MEYNAEHKAHLDAGTLLCLDIEDLDDVIMHAIVYIKRFFSLKNVD